MTKKEEKEQSVDPSSDENIDEMDIETLKKERDEYLSGWKRMKADYDNLVKEDEKRRSEYTDWAREQILSQLLPAIDQYDIALQFTPDISSLDEANQKIFRNWIVGLEAVRSLWWDAATEMGLKKIEITGVFNADLHEAVGEEASETIEKGSIIRATMNGYLLNEKVIRCAKVIVSSGIKSRESGVGSGE